MSKEVFYFQTKEEADTLKEEFLTDFEARKNNLLLLGVSTDMEYTKVPARCYRICGNLYQYQEDIPVLCYDWSNLPENFYVPDYCKVLLYKDTYTYYSLPVGEYTALVEEWVQISEHTVHINPNTLNVSSRMDEDIVFSGLRAYYKKLNIILSEKENPAIAKVGLETYIDMSSYMLRDILRKALWGSNESNIEVPYYCTDTILSKLLYEISGFSASVPPVVIYNEIFNEKMCINTKLNLYLSTDTTCIKEYFGVIPELDSNGSVKRDSIKKVIKGLFDNGFHLTLKNKEVKDRSFTDSEVQERWKDALNLGTYKLNNILEITFFAI